MPRRKHATRPYVSEKRLEEVQAGQSALGHRLLHANHCPLRVRRGGENRTDIGLRRYSTNQGTIIIRTSTIQRPMPSRAESVIVTSCR